MTGAGELANLLAVDAQSVLELMVFSAWKNCLLCVCVFVYVVQFWGVYMHGKPNTEPNKPGATIPPP